MKKTIVLTFFVTLVIITTGYFSYKAYSYQNLKKDCLNSIKNGHVNPVQVVYTSGTKAQFESIKSDLKGIKGVGDITYETSEESLESFLDTQDDLTQEDIEKLKVNNPLQPVVEILISDWSLVDPDELKDKVIAGSKANSLEIYEYRESINLPIIKKQLLNINNASFIKDFSRFITTNDQNFFKVNYSNYCFAQKSQ